MDGGRASRNVFDWPEVFLADKRLIKTPGRRTFFELNPGSLHVLDTQWI